MLSLHKILLPTHTNDGHSYDWAHSQFRERVAVITGGLTELVPVKGLWRSPAGNMQHETLIPYEVACERDQWPRIVELARGLFPDQHTLFTALIGFVDMEAGLNDATRYQFEQEAVGPYSLLPKPLNDFDGTTAQEHIARRPCVA